MVREYKCILSVSLESPGRPDRPGRMGVFLEIFDCISKIDIRSHFAPQEWARLVRRATRGRHRPRVIHRHVDPPTPGLAPVLGRLAQGHAMVIMACPEPWVRAALMAAREMNLYIEAYPTV